VVHRNEHRREGGGREGEIKTAAVRIIKTKATHQAFSNAGGASTGHDAFEDKRGILCEAMSFGVTPHHDNQFKWDDAQAKAWLAGQLFTQKDSVVCIQKIGGRLEDIFSVYINFWDIF
jgi:pyruvoyl-dependent arginine decarboxylase (PvlArgDC)